MHSVKKIIVSLEQSRGYGRDLLAGISQYSRFFGPWNIYTPQPFYYQTTTDKLDISYMINRWGADGMILREEPDIQKYIDLKIPLIVVTYKTRKYPGIVCLEGRTPGAGEMAAEHLLERGFRHFGYCGIPGMYWSQDRGLSFQKKIEEAGYDVDLYGMNQSSTDWIWEQDQIGLFNWIGSLPKPVGIMTCTDDRARDVLEVCKMLKLTVPFEVAVIGVDNDDLLCNMLNPPLSSVALNTKKAGHEAAATLDQLMQNKEVDTDKTITAIAAHVFARQSTDVFEVDDEWTRMAIRYIHNNTRKPINVDDVVRGVAVSRRTLFNKFKQNLGMSVHEYIKKKRVEEIEKLLLETNIPVSNIALMMGYTSSHHIATYFNSVKGVNPNDYRKENKIE